MGSYFWEISSFGIHVHSQKSQCRYVKTILTLKINNINILRVLGSEKLLVITYWGFWFSKCFAWKDNLRLKVLFLFTSSISVSQYGMVSWSHFHISIYSRSICGLGKMVFHLKHKFVDVSPILFILNILYRYKRNGLPMLQVFVRELAYYLQRWHGVLSYFLMSSSSSPSLLSKVFEKLTKKRF